MSSNLQKLIDAGKAALATTNATTPDAWIPVRRQDLVETITALGQLQVMTQALSYALAGNGVTLPPEPTPAPKRATAQAEDKAYTLRQEDQPILDMWAFFEEHAKTLAYSVRRKPSQGDWDKVAKRNNWPSAWMVKNRTGLTWTALLELLDVPFEHKTYNVAKALAVRHAKHAEPAPT